MTTSDNESNKDYNSNNNTNVSPTKLSRSKQIGFGRRGPWSEKEKKFIEANYGRMTHEDLAKHLRRDASVIKKYIREQCNSQVLDKKIVEDARFKLKDSLVWEDLKRQFSKEELDMFLFHWSRTISQFKEDVLPTEEMQIVDMIKLDILMNRSLTQQSQTNSMINDLNARREDELDKAPEKRDIAKLDNLERQIGILRNSQVAMSSDYRDIQTRKNNILKEMKATRDARIKDIESDKLTISSFLIKLTEDKDTRLRIGKEMEKMRLAVESEYIRLSELHKYEDGVLDKPILDEENVNK